MFNTYSNLYKEVSQMLLKCWDVLVETEQAFNEDSDLGSEKRKKCCIFFDHFKKKKNEKNANVNNFPHYAQILYVH